LNGIDVLDMELIYFIFYILFLISEKDLIEVVLPKPGGLVKHKCKLINLL
jgi:hypothetical protein